jgi:choline kinase
MQAVVLCAGNGSRLGAGIPKCLVEIQGETLLENIVTKLEEIPSIKDIIIVTGFKHGLVEKEVERLRQKIGKRIVSVHNSEAQSYGIVKSLSVAWNFIYQPSVLRLSGDLYFSKEATLDRLVASTLTTVAKQKAPASRALTAVLETTENERVVSLNLKIPASSDFEWMDMEVYHQGDFQRMLARGADFHALGRHHFELLNFCIKNGMQIYTQEINGVYEIDTPEDLEYVKARPRGC